MVLLQSIGGQVILTVSVATAIGRSVNILALPESNASRRRACISAANTPRSRLRAISKAQWKPVSEPQMRSFRLCASRFLSSCHLLQVLGIPSALHFNLRGSAFDL